MNKQRGKLMRIFEVISRYFGFVGGLAYGLAELIIDWFDKHKSFKAKTKQFGLVLLAIVIVATVISAIVPSNSPVTPTQPVKAVSKPNPPTKDELLSLVNAERAKNGVAPLTEDSRLDTSAQEKAQDELTYNYYDHISPVGSPYAGTQGYKLIDTTGLKCVYESENLTMGVTGDPNTAQNDVSAWINSPDHHQALINPSYTLTGFGIAGPYAVEHFCQL